MDDYLWYVHMWLDAYGWVGGASKLEEARETFQIIFSMGSDEPCGGLLWMWPDADPRKNSITVLEAIKAAARLALLDAQNAQNAASFRAIALRLWDWFESVGLLGDGGLVLDHVTGSADGQMYCCNATSAELGRQAQGSTAVHGAVCEPRGTTTWTYNQGMLLGAMVELSELTGEDKYLRVGASVLDAVVLKMVSVRALVIPPLYRAGSCPLSIRSHEQELRGSLDLGSAEPREEG
jgi:predicted alpha-1,6-mannanase (GH76 family)